MSRNTMLPLRIHFTDGTTSFFIHPKKQADAIVLRNHLLSIKSFMGDWWEAEAFCNEYTINNKPCRMPTKEELEQLDNFVPSINQVLNALKLPSLEGSFWGSDSYPGINGELAVIKELGSEKLSVWTYKTAKNFFKALPIQPC